MKQTKLSKMQKNILIGLYDETVFYRRRRARWEAAGSPGIIMPSTWDPKYWAVEDSATQAVNSRSHSAAISRSLRRLRQRGLVEETSRDRTTYMPDLTELGEQVAEALHAEAIELDRECAETSTNG